MMQGRKKQGAGLSGWCGRCSASAVPTKHPRKLGP